MCFAPQRRALFRHVNFQTWSGNGVLCTFWLGNLVRENSVHFFDMSTSKSGLGMVCFVHFDWKMCFAPQRRALFWHLNFQKCRVGVLCTFWLGNMLRTTTACNFSSLICPNGSAPAALASLLFDPPEPQIIGKTQCFATFLPFRAPASSFFWLFLFSDLLSSSLLLFSSLTLPISAFHLSILSEVWLLNFLRSSTPSATFFRTCWTNQDKPRQTPISTCSSPPVPQFQSSCLFFHPLIPWGCLATSRLQNSSWRFFLRHNSQGL